MPRLGEGLRAVEGWEYLRDTDVKRTLSYLVRRGALERTVVLCEGHVGLTREGRAWLVTQGHRVDTPAPAVATST